MFTKLAGQTDTQRIYSFNRILATTALLTMTADFVAPPGAVDVLIGIQYRCRTCVLNKGFSKGTIHVRQ